MIKDCPHYEAAAAFLDFCSSAEYQQARAVENCARGVNVGISYGNYPADVRAGRGHHRLGVAGHPEGRPAEKG